jgi:hypothetical protein
MQYALTISSAGSSGDARSVAEFARIAEESGWDGLFLEDYVMHWGDNFKIPTYDPWIALAASAMTTKRLRLGIIVTPLARRRPWKVARESLTLDHLSNGRFILGVGLGNGKDPDFARFGEITDNSVRARRLDEALDVIAGLWTGDSFSYHGEHFQINDVSFLPRPVQRIPIWIGGGWPLKQASERMARWDGSCMYKQSAQGIWEDMTPEDIRQIKAFVASRRSASIPFDIVVGGRERRDDWDLERAHIRSVAEAGATWWVEHIEPADFDVMRAAIERGPLRVE